MIVPATVDGRCLRPRRLLAVRIRLLVFAVEVDMDVWSRLDKFVGSGAPEKKIVSIIY